MHALSSDAECTAIDVTVLAKQSLLQLGHILDHDIVQQQEIHSMASEDYSPRDDPETGPRTRPIMLGPTSEGSQPPPLTEHPAAPKGRKSEHKGAIVHFFSC